MKILGHVSSHMGPVQGITEWTDFVWSLYLPPKWLYLNLDWKILNNPPSTGFVCFTILMPIYVIFQKKSCVFTGVWSYPEHLQFLEHYWGSASWPGQWPEPDSCLHRGGWRQMIILINNSHIQHQQLSTGQLRLDIFSNDDNLPRTGAHPESRVWWTVSGTPPSVEPSSISSL